MRSMLAISPRLTVPRRAAGCERGIHKSGSNCPRLIASSGAGSAPGLAVIQPRPVSARCWRTGENSASSGVSSQTTSTSAPAAADRSADAVLTVRASGRAAGMTNRSRGPALVAGQEHFADALTRLACAAVTVTDPATGRVIGVVDVTCTAVNASPLMLPLVKRDRKRTRLNSSHRTNSYAVFCLKKKKPCTVSVTAKQRLDQNHDNHHCAALC